MLDAFLAVFTVAFVLSILTLLIIEDDLKRKSERVIYVMLIVIVAWPVSLTQLSFQPSSTTTTTGIPLNCVVLGANAVTANTPTSCGTTTEVQTSITNFPTLAFYSYMTFSLGITVIFILLFIKYMTEYGLTLFLDGLKSIFKGKRR